MFLSVLYGVLSGAVFIFIFLSIRIFQTHYHCRISGSPFKFYWSELTQITSAKARVYFTGEEINRNRKLNHLEDAMNAYKAYVNKVALDTYLQLREKNFTDTRIRGMICLTYINILETRNSRGDHSIPVPLVSRDFVFKEIIFYPSPYEIVTNIDCLAEYIQRTLKEDDLGFVLEYNLNVFLMDSLFDQVILSKINK